jgi:hypothetical protein
MEIGSMISSDVKIIKNPDQIVEDNILEALQKESLISDVELNKLKTKIAAGTMKADAWKLMFEMSIDNDANKTEISNEN